MATTVKIYFTLPSGKQEIRRFTTESASVLEALLEFLTATYSKHYAPPLRFSLSYDDGEDCCSVSSEAELQEGLQLHAASGAGGVLKLLCSFDEAPLGQSVSSSPSATASGLSTPSFNAMLGHTVPPSPSHNGPSASPAPAPAAAAAAPVVQEPVVEETNDEPSAPAGPPSPTASARSEEGELVNDSDDEYIRIEEDQPAKSPEVEFKSGAKPVVVQRQDVEAFEPSSVTIVSASAPVVEESAPSSSPVTIEDVTGHPAAQTNSGVVHSGITCDGCGMSPLVGTRYRCKDCTNPGGFDFCAGCNQTEGHFPLSHEFEKIDVPRQLQCPFMASASSSSASSSSSSSSSASAPTGPAVHSGVTCDGCRLSPIVGNRYHCTTCTVPGGFDLCEKCESTGTAHPADHLMMKMRAPAVDSIAPALPRGIRHGAGARRGHCPFRAHRDASTERPKAQFISDVTCADGMQVHAGETLRKTWSIKNVGPAAWPAGVRLVFAGGELSPESENRSDAFGALVPFAGPGDVVHVSIDIVVPKEEGRFRGTFRLQTADGIRFGPRIWIDLSVPAEAVEAAAAQSAPAAAVAAAPAAPAASMVEAPKAVEAAVKTAPVEAAAAPKASAPLPVAQPVVVAAPVVAPVSASAVSAPVVIASPAASESKQREEESAQLAAEFAAAHIAPVAAAEAAPRASSSFAYSNQAAILRSMGFMDKELCRYLLINNKGDLEKVVAWLLNNASSA